MYKDITILIKTFERPRNLMRLLRSIFIYYPYISVIIADDGHDAQKNKKRILKKWNQQAITYLVLPYDVGLSAGRNSALKHVDTKFFLLCDDDFVFDERTDILHLRAILEEKQIDLVAGTLFENRDRKTALFNFLERRFHAICWDMGLFPKLRTQKLLCGIFRWPEPRTLALEICSDTQSDTFVSDIGFNFFLARTEIRSKVRWRDELKLLEHLVFFYDFKRAGLRMMVTKTVGVNHLRDMGLHYRKKRYRDDNRQYQNLRLRMLDIDHYYGNANPIILHQDT